MGRGTHGAFTLVVWIVLSSGYQEPGVPIYSGLDDGYIGMVMTTMMKTCAVLAVAPLAALPLMAVPAPGQDLDGGRLEVRTEGRRVAIERFRVWRSGSTVNAVANIERGQAEPLQVGLQMEPEIGLVRYELREGGVPIITGERLSDRYRFHFQMDGQERWKEYPVRGPLLILEPGVVHHHQVLAWAFVGPEPLIRLGQGPIDVLLPREDRILEASIQYVEVLRGGATIDESNHNLRLEIRVGDESREVWLGEERQLLRVVDTSTGREAIRWDR